MSRMRPEQVILINKKITNMQLLSIQSLTKQAVLTVSPEALWKEARKRELWPWCQRCSVGSVLQVLAASLPLGLLLWLLWFVLQEESDPQAAVVGAHPSLVLLRVPGSQSRSQHWMGRFSHCCSSWDLDRELGLAGGCFVWGVLLLFFYHVRHRVLQYNEFSAYWIVTILASVL